MKERKKTIMLLIGFLLALAIGACMGYSTLKYEVVHYEGVVIGKNYEPRKIEKIEQQIEVDETTQDIQSLKVKEASYTLLIKNIAGQKYRLSVSEEIFITLSLIHI